MVNINSDSVKKDLLRLKSIQERIVIISEQLKSPNISIGLYNSLFREKQALHKKAHHLTRKIKDLISGYIMLVVYSDNVSNTVYRKCFTNIIDINIARFLIELYYPDGITILEYKVYQAEQLSSLL